MTFVSAIRSVTSLHPEEIDEVRVRVRYSIVPIIDGSTEAPDLVTFPLMRRTQSIRRR